MFLWRDSWCDVSQRQAESLVKSSFVALHLYESGDLDVAIESLTTI